MLVIFPSASSFCFRSYTHKKKKKTNCGRTKEEEKESCFAVVVGLLCYIYRVASFCETGSSIVGLCNIQQDRTNTPKKKRLDCTYTHAHDIHTQTHSQTNKQANTDGKIKPKSEEKCKTYCTCSLTFTALLRLLCSAYVCDALHFSKYMPFHCSKAHLKKKKTLPPPSLISALFYFLFRILSLRYIALA